MKIFFLAFITLVSFSFFLSSCEDESFKDPIMLQLEGTWDIVDENDNYGTITFSHDETFTMETNKGNIAYGDVSLSIEDNTLSITYAEDEEGNEYLTEEDYDNGYFCKIQMLNENTLYVNNLPYFRNQIVMLIRKK